MCVHSPSNAGTAADGSPGDYCQKKVKDLPEIFNHVIFTVDKIKAMNKSRNKEKDPHTAATFWSNSSRIKFILWPLLVTLAGFLLPLVLARC
ncbi:MAG TPA: hypothetical protein VFR58_08210 [Flavisolibacter sp.]|nr:hypothetical protein [Flavisolibacter sp.]